MPDVNFSNQYPYTDFHELNLDWVIETVKHWADLVGKTIQSITLTGTTGLVDTYTINYSDGTTSTFTVTNGRGITSIALTGSLGLVDTYTITYNDGSTSTFQINNGNGISSIEKTGTSGLIDTYTITFTDGSSTTFEVKNGAEAIDATLTLPGYAADAAAVGAALDLKQNAADPAGLAENLTPYSPDSGVYQDQPFILQGTGTGNGESVVDTGSYAQIQKKLGNMVCVNQLVQNHDFSDGTNNWAVYDSSKASLSVSGGIATLTFLSDTGTYSRGLRQTLSVAPVIGRKYLISVRAKASAAGSYTFDFAGSPSASTEFVLQANTWTTVYLITTAAGTSQTFIIEPKPGVADVNDTLEISYVILSDLTLWYGSNDRIPSDLLSHPENWGRYYAGSLAYAAGYLDSADGTVMTSIGRNQWDEEWEVGGSDGQGGKGTALNAIISKNYRPAIPNKAYYFYCAGYTNAYYLSVMWYDVNKTYLGRQWCCGTTAVAPSNAAFFKIYTNSGSYIYGGTYNNDITVSPYYSGESGYDQHYPYSVLAEVDTGSEVLRSTGAVADEKTPDGTITRKVGIVDLGMLTWTYESGVFYSTGTSATANPQQYPKCSRYVANDDGSDMSIYIGNSGILYVYDSRYTNAAAFQTAMNGVEMTYELITYSTETGSAFTPTIDIDDFGSMSWNVTNGIPQGIEIFYPADYKAAIDTLLNMVDGDVGKIVTTDTYPDVPAADGTYVLKATVSSGTVTRSWVLE